MATYFKVEMKSKEGKALSASLSPFDGGVKWGEAIKQLKWSEEQAKEDFASFSN